ncbi:YkuD domain-containing protein [Frankia sp. AiPs1]|uniref:hypothetical protein n=1 Tax=Frankia sp. AiPa1 TaxID=573492 RepID=UPI00202B3E48|nr:hypothetical protein [Frankia sp. AiPa1]MCL9761482.1 hypothetical protein [Frankia sp. AiPa1]
MADHRRRRRATRSGADAVRARPSVIIAAAAGTTLVVGAAGALNLGSSPAHRDGTSARVASAPSSAPATTAGSTVAAATAAATRGSARSVRPNWAAGPVAGGSGATATAAGSGGVGGFAVGGGAAVPGIGSVMMSRVPRDARQVIVVSGAGHDASINNVTLWQRADEKAPWVPYGVPMTGRNGANGWTETHREGDLRSPIGVFGLTAAGGRLPDPGTAMPYEYRPSFYQTAAPQGEPMADAFNYVVAIDYNRVAGRPPSDPARPLGDQVGGDIWLHVDHQSATRACVALPQGELVSILRWLSPSSHPVLVMGDVADLGAEL